LLLFNVVIAHLIEIKVFLGVSIDVDLAHHLVVIEVSALLLITIQLLSLCRNNCGSIPFPANLTKQDR